MAYNLRVYTNAGRNVHRGHTCTLVKAIKGKAIVKCCGKVVITTMRVLRKYDPAKALKEIKAIAAKLPPLFEEQKND